MTKLIFITHPAVEVSADVPIAQWPLSEEGQVAATRLLDLPLWQEVSALYASDEPKAREVGDMAAGRHNLQLQIEPKLGEFDRQSTGLLSPAEYKSAMEKFYEYPDISFRGWETANAASTRVVNAASAIISANAGKTVAIIGHGATGTLLICHLTDTLPNILAEPPDMGCYTVLDWEEKKMITPWKKY